MVQNIMLKKIVQTILGFSHLIGTDGNNKCFY